MIIVRICGSLEQQLSQYAFGNECARLLQTELKLDITTCVEDKRYCYALDEFTLDVKVASEQEIENSRQICTIIEDTLLFNQEIFARICDGMYLEGVWADYLYAEASILDLAASIQPLFSINDEYQNILAKIEASSDSVALDFRGMGSAKQILPLCYFEDAIREVRARVPNAHLFVLSDSKILQLNIEGNSSTIVAEVNCSDAQYLQLMRYCRHHIVTYNSLSSWAARLNSKMDGVIIAPQQAFHPFDAELIRRFGSIRQPAWPPSWLIIPVRISQTLPAVTSIKGGCSNSRPIRVGVLSCYDEVTRNGYLFKNQDTSIGANLLKPWCDLYEYGQAHGIQFVTLDQIKGVEDINAVIFMDRPTPGLPLVDALMQSPVRKYLLTYECEVIKPDNWDVEYHKLFDRIFTWHDEFADGRRYIKNNFVIDTCSPFDFEVIKSAFDQRRLVTIIAGAKLSQHPNELYSHRVRAIHWFEGCAPQDFDLYGVGWDVNNFPSYRGKVSDKLSTLANYRFVICYENAKAIPGYITEKILDCFRAGTVPVYGGAPNIARWIPQDCYIDIGQFQTYDQVYKYLKEMDVATYTHYLDRIHDFLSSGKAYPFSIECFIRTVTEVVAWDVSVSRGETPHLLQEARTQGRDLPDANLRQNLNTMQIELESLPLDLSRFKPEFRDEEARHTSCQNTGRADLIVLLSYGEELPVYMRARALWDFYISHFPNINAYFVRTTKKLSRGEVTSNGYDLLVGIGDEDCCDGSGLGYKETGVWSASENANVIYRQMAVFDYLLRKYPNPFYLYTPTVTSVVDFRGLLAVIEKMPKTRCFGGLPIHMPDPQILTLLSGGRATFTREAMQLPSRLTFPSGANTFFSRDTMELLRNRYNQNHPYATLPNDVWQGLLLQDIPRTPLPLLSFLEPRSSISDMNEVKVLTNHLLKIGHFHFRIKTSSVDNGLAKKREDVDPWIMLKIMETILESFPAVEASRHLVDKLELSQGAYDVRGVFVGSLDFPMTDLEARTVYSNSNH